MNFKQQLREAYDKDAQRRDKMEKNRDEWKIKLREQFVSLLKKKNKKTILELGSGAGLEAKYFQESGFDILATDLSKEMIKMCKKRGLNARVLDLYHLSTLGKKFDAVFSMNVLLHVPRKDLKQVLTNIYEVLKNNGVFFYGVYGGKDEEKVITDKTKMGLPRLFSFLSDQSLADVVGKQFETISFEHIYVNKQKKDFYFQALFLIKR